jgi:CheY-like chemotaxis protein
MDAEREMRLPVSGILVLVGALLLAWWVGGALEELRSAGERLRVAPGERPPHVAAAEPEPQEASPPASPGNGRSRAILLVAAAAAGALLAGGLARGGLRARREAGRSRLVNVGALDPRTVHVLVVDDDADLRVALCARLQGWGYQTCAAWDGVSAIQATRKAPPTLMLLDLGMPGGDGFTVMSRLNQLGLTKHLPVIVLTAADARTSKWRALELGAASFLQKPVDKEVLRAAIQRVVVPVH